MMSRDSVITRPSSSMAGSRPRGTSAKNSLGLSPEKSTCIPWRYVGFLLKLDVTWPPKSEVRRNKKERRPSTIAIAHHLGLFLCVGVRACVGASAGPCLCLRVCACVRASACVWVWACAWCVCVCVCESKAATGQTGKPSLAGICAKIAPSKALSLGREGDMRI